MNTTPTPSHPLNEITNKTRKELLQRNPFLSEKEVQERLDNPSSKPKRGKAEGKYWIHNNPD